MSGFPLMVLSSMIMVLLLLAARQGQAEKGSVDYLEWQILSVGQVSTIRFKAKRSDNNAADTHS